MAIMSSKYAGRACIIWSQGSRWVRVEVTLTVPVVGELCRRGRFIHRGLDPEPWSATFDTTGSEKTAILPTRSCGKAHMALLGCLTWRKGRLDGIKRQNALARCRQRPSFMFAKPIDHREALAKEKKRGVSRLNKHETGFFSFQSRSGQSSALVFTVCCITHGGTAPATRKKYGNGRAGRSVEGG